MSQQIPAPDVPTTETETLAYGHTVETVPIEPTTRHAGSPWAVWAVVAAAVLCAAVGLTGCTGTRDYTQTWSKGYGDTTCREWSGAMSDDQRLAASADMLVAMRPGTDIPSDSVVDDFESGMAEECAESPGSDIGTTGGLLYSMSSGEFDG